VGPTIKKKEKQNINKLMHVAAKIQKQAFAHIGIYITCTPGL